LKKAALAVAVDGREGEVGHLDATGSSIPDRWMREEVPPRYQGTLAVVALGNIRGVGLSGEMEEMVGEVEVGL